MKNIYLTIFHSRIDVAISGSTCSNDAGGIGTYFINSQDDSTCEISGPY